MILDVTRVFLQKFLLRLCQGTFQSSRAEQKKKEKKQDLEKGRNIPELLVQFILSSYQIMTSIGCSVTEI